MFLADKIKGYITEGLKELYSYDAADSAIQLQVTKKEFSGSHTLVLFPLAKSLATSPRVIGEELGDWLTRQVYWVTAYEVIGGFLNITLSDSIWLSGLASMRVGEEVSPEFVGKRVLIEMSCPNTNKPLHLGHLRNVFLGSAMGNILEALGCNVDRVQMINDRGIHICKSMVGYLHFGEGKTPTTEGIKGDHFVGRYYVAFEQAYSKEVKELTDSLGDEELAKKQSPIMQEAKDMLCDWEVGKADVVALWEQMNQWVYDGFNATYKRLNVAFDKTYYESSTYLLGKKVVEEGLAKGVFYRKEDGSVWVDLTEEGLDKKLLLRGDGTAVYMTQDLGTAELRYKDFSFDRSIYVVGNEQDYHFAALFAILKKLGRPYAKELYHLSYGMVDLPSGKMKSREGKVVDADHLLDDMITLAGERTEELGKVEDFALAEKERLIKMIGIGALRYFLLRVSAVKRILFDPKKSIDFQGHTAPFVQYVHARIAALVRKGSSILSDYDLTVQQSTMNMAPLERELVEELLRLVDVVLEAGLAYNPAPLVEYVYNLAKVYNRFYADIPILKEEDVTRRRFRLFLSKKTGEVIHRAMGLLDIEVPTQM